MQERPTKPSFHPIALSSAALVPPSSAPSIVSLALPWTGVVRHLHVLSPQFDVIALRVGAESDHWAEAQPLRGDGEVRSYAFARGLLVGAGTTLALSVANRGTAPAFFEAQLICESAADRPRIGTGALGALREARPTLRLADPVPTLRLLEGSPSAAPEETSLPHALVDALEVGDLPRVAWLAEQLWAAPDGLPRDLRPVWRALARFTARRAAP